MFGKILEISEDEVIIENISGKVETQLLGIHLVFEEKHKILAEISNITKDKVTCLLKGEFEGNEYKSGLDHKPGSNSLIRAVTKDEVISIMGEQVLDSPNSLYIGKNITYEGFNVSANINSFFSNHFAIIGNSGSGKSCTVARLFQNLFYRKNNAPINSHFALFDVYGEYHNALNMINKTEKCRCKYLTTNTHVSESDIVKIPPYLLEVDDIALLLGATSALQLPIIEKALKYVLIFTEEDDTKVIKCKNGVIAKAVLDILTSGKNPNQIRDQVIAVLSAFNTKELNLSSEIVQPGYTRTLMQCLNIDATGKINAMQLVIEFLEKYISEETSLEINVKSHYYTLKDLYNAFEFALISEGVLKSDSVYDLNNILKVRLDGIIDSNYGKYFEYDEYITKEEYIKRLYTASNGGKVQIVNFNLNYVDERFAKTLTKIYSKMFLDYAITLEDHQSFSVDIILEEAHRYVREDTDEAILGYNIFDRITKEGRKYGVLLGMITQRPCEISTTALSQCSNYIVLRMFHPDDIAVIKSITHSVSEYDIDKLKTLTSGTALCFGTAFKMPVYTKIDKPNPTPSSNNIDVTKQWFGTQTSEQNKNTIEVIQ